MPMSRYDRHCMDTLLGSGGVLAQDTVLSVGATAVFGSAVGGDITLTLPAVLPAAGNTYTIRNVGDSGTVTVQDSATPDFQAPLAAGESMMMVSDGVYWHEITLSPVAPVSN